MVVGRIVKDFAWFNQSRSFIFFTFSSQSIHLHRKLWDLHFVLHRDHLEETTSLKNCGDVMDLKLGLLKTKIARCGWTLFFKSELDPSTLFWFGLFLKVACGWLLWIWRSRFPGLHCLRCLNLATHFKLQWVGGSTLSRFFAASPFSELWWTFFRGAKSCKNR